MGLQSLELAEEELTTMLENTNEASYNDTERIRKFDRIANIANLAHKLLLEEESMSKGNKRRLEERVSTCKCDRE